MQRPGGKHPGPLLLWSWVFEFLLPANPYFSRWCTRDYLDIVYYALGALLAAVFWTWWYARRVSISSTQ